MRYLIISLILTVATTVHAARITKQLEPPPPGATLPVLIDRTLTARNLQPGQPVSARLAQIVPISAQVCLPQGAKLDGHVVNVSASSISILFDQLSWKGRTLPVHVRLVAAAAYSNVYEARLPLGGSDRGTASPADWTTRQVGGDEVYLSAGTGTVYDKYSRPVGFADFTGVYSSPAPGKLPRAMGPFSTTATGLHGLDEFSIVSAGGAGDPITLAISSPAWHILSGSALLLEVVP
jgi:hypothetical protein